MRPFIIVIIFLSYSCNRTDTTKHTETKEHRHDVILNDTTLSPIEQELRNIPKEVKPVFGYRFNVSGDFDGDGEQEILTEHYFSKKENKETNKFYNGLEKYDQLVALAINKEPLSFVTCNNNRIDTLIISSGRQLLGLSLLRNEGDLNHDGTDEISYVVNWADWSNINTCHIMTYQGNKWKELYSFGIWDWQLPDLPLIVNQYGPVGLENKITIPENDTLYKKMEEMLLGFEGFIKRMDHSVIQIRFRNEEFMKDTMLVDLSVLITE